LRNPHDGKAFGMPGQSAIGTRDGVKPFAGYAREPLPIGGYAILMAVYGGLLGGFLAALRLRGKPLPERLSLGDVALLGTATYKASRVLSKDLVTSPIRAPFARVEEVEGTTEVKESARGEGIRRAIGELLICPYCLGSWVASAFVAGHAADPRTTRFLASILVVYQISDELHNRLG
jgi:hypothetical protein